MNTRGRGCTSDPTTLCIDGAISGDRRFQVTVAWQTVQDGGRAGQGNAVSIAPLGFARGGVFWFFDATNPELLVKVLDGCGANGHFWVFASAGTNVGLTLTVADTATGRVRSWINPDLTPAVRSRTRGPSHVRKIARRRARLETDA
jgi:hypothetical protein